MIEPILHDIHCGLILNDVDVTNLPIDLGEWEIDRASDVEMQAVRAAVTRASLSDWSPYPMVPQEMSITLGNVSQREVHWERISDPGGWRYSVLRLKRGRGFDCQTALSQALRLSASDLRVELWLTRVSGGNHPIYPGGVLGHPARAMQFFSRLWNSSQLPQLIDPDELRATMRIRSEFDDEGFPRLLRALEQFEDIDNLPETSTSKFLAYMSVIEAVLCHNPASGDSLDSITRQLKRNLALINNSLSGPAGLHLDRFLGASIDQVVARIYGYRSAVAHGDTGADDKQWLNNHAPKDWDYLGDDWINWFARGLTKRVLLAALSHPQLITDLRR